MKLPRVQFTARRMMIITATLAVSWAFFFGIAELCVYRPNLEAEQYYREKAAVLEAENVRAPEWRKMAEDMARSNHDSWPTVATFFGLLAARGLSAGLGLVLWTRSRLVSSPRPEKLHTLVSVCSTATKILVVGLRPVMVLTLMTLSSPLPRVWILT
jgi:hypothetical protein